MGADSPQARYKAALHAMQSGVKIDHATGGQDGSPKHLRVGVNAAMVDHAALVKLLMAKGVITEAEYFEALAEGMEAEAKSYSDKLGVGLA